MNWMYVHSWECNFVVLSRHLCQEILHIGGTPPEVHEVLHHPKEHSRPVAIIVVRQGLRNHSTAVWAC